MNLDFRTVVLHAPSCSWRESGLPNALSGDTTQAHNAYQDFLTLWKDGDPDIPILKEAKAEYAKLQ